MNKKKKAQNSPRPFIMQTVINGELVECDISNNITLDRVIEAYRQTWFKQSKDESTGI